MNGGDTIILPQSYRHRHIRWAKFFKPRIPYSDLKEINLESNRNAFMQRPPNPVEIDVHYRKIGGISMEIFRTCPITTALDVIEMRSHLVRHGVTILIAPTGSGKSNALPEMIFDALHLQRNSDGKMYKKWTCKILIVEPNRELVRALYSRLSDVSYLNYAAIMGERVGDDECSLGDMEKANVLITTPTIAKGLLKKYKHHELDAMIFDEAHCRSADYSSIISNCGRLGPRLFLVSATLPEREEISQFLLATGASVKTLHINVVKRFEKEDAMNARIREEEEKEGMYPSNERIMEIRDEISMDDPVYGATATSPRKEVQLSRVMCLFKKVVTKMEKRKEIGVNSIVVFLDGINSIFKFCEMAHQNVPSNTKIKFFMIHSELPLDYDVHKAPKSGELTVIVATSAGQAGLTFPNAKYLIDSCLQKIPSNRLPHNIFSLALKWSDGAALDQREGRIGRTGDGEVYITLTEKMVENIKNTNHTTECINRSFSSMELLSLVDEVNLTVDEMLFNKQVFMRKRIDKIDERSFDASVREAFGLGLVHVNRSGIPFLTDYGDTISMICDATGVTPRMVRGVLSGCLNSCLSWTIKAVAVSEFAMRLPIKYKEMGSFDNRRDHEAVVDFFDSAMEKYYAKDRSKNIDWNAIDAIRDAIQRALKAVLAIFHFHCADLRAIPQQMNLRENSRRHRDAALVMAIGDHIVFSDDQQNNKEKRQYQTLDGIKHNITSDILVRSNDRGRKYAVYSYLTLVGEPNQHHSLLTEVTSTCVTLFASTSSPQRSENTTITVQTNTGELKLQGISAVDTENVMGCRDGVERMLHYILKHGSMNGISEKRFSEVENGPESNYLHFFSLFDEIVENIC